MERDQSDTKHKACRKLFLQGQWVDRSKATALAQATAVSGARLIQNIGMGMRESLLFALAKPNFARFQQLSSLLPLDITFSKSKSSTVSWVKFWCSKKVGMF